MLGYMARGARAAVAAVVRPRSARLFSTATAGVDAAAPATGFEATGVRCGIKKKPLVSDFCLIRSSTPCAAAGVFTTNQFCAAPVHVSKSVLASHASSVHGVVINAGCANACTGEQGMRDAEEMVRLASGVASTPNALVMSTGVIGPFLPMEKIRAGFDAAVTTLPAAKENPVEGWTNAALAVMTTDTHHKVLHRSFELDNKKFTFSGICKGAGMIHPNMATMLAVVATDLSVAPSALQAALSYAADRSFNSISIDGDTSTNDSLVVLANGQAPAWKQQGAAGKKDQYGITGPSDPQFPAFQSILTAYLIELAHKIVRDGEGATKFVTVTVTSARSYKEAKTIANSIATSMLVKTALFGQDANWGRILCATGYAGVPIDANKVNLYIRPTKDVHAPPAEAAHSAHGSMPPTALTDGAASAAGRLGPLHLVKGGQPFQCDEAHASALFRERDITLHVDLGLGAEDATVWTCDLSNEYVNINADYRS